MEWKNFSYFVIVYFVGTLSSGTIVEKFEMKARDIKDNTLVHKWLAHRKLVNGGAEPSSRPVA